MIWRKLSEMKPSEDGEYIVYFDGQVSTAFWDSDYFYCSFLGPDLTTITAREPSQIITHWMNLPEPPEDK
jgi:hypothetical protein